MRAIIIDSFNHTIFEKEVTSLADMQKIIKGYIEVAHVFENKDTLFVNEEGLLREDIRCVAFHLVSIGKTFAGNGLIVGWNPANGDSISSKSDIKLIRNDISFPIVLG